MHCRTVTHQWLKVALMSGLFLASTFAGAPLSAQEPPDADRERFPTQVGAMSSFPA